MPFALALVAGMAGFMYGRRGFSYLHLARKSKLGPVRTKLPGDLSQIPGTDYPKDRVTIINGAGSNIRLSLNPGDVAYAERGSMIAKDARIEMQLTVSPVMRTAKGAINSLLSGEGIGLIEFTNKTEKSAELVLGTHHGHGMAAIPLQGDEAVYCKRGAFHASLNPVSFAFQRINHRSISHFSKLGLGLQALRAQGEPAIAVIASKNLIESRVLSAGETWDVHHGSLLAFTGSAQIGVKEQPGFFTRMGSEEGGFLTTVTGPGRIWYEVPVHDRHKTSLRRAILEKLIPG